MVEMLYSAKNMTFVSAFALTQPPNDRSAVLHHTNGVLHHGQFKQERTCFSAGMSTAFSLRDPADAASVLCTLS